MSVTEADDLEITNKEDQSVTEKEPALDEVCDDIRDGSKETNPNLNMANPDYKAILKDNWRAELEVKHAIKEFLSDSLTSEVLTHFKLKVVGSKDGKLTKI